MKRCDICKFEREKLILVTIRQPEERKERYLICESCVDKIYSTVTYLAFENKTL